MRKRQVECAALLNPASAEPIVWPSFLKFMSELNHEAKALLECALMEANRERENVISTPSPLDSDQWNDNLSEASDAELCGICFEEACTIQVKECGHLMCAQCTLALCCHNKPNPATYTPSVPLCPFCRSSIVKLVARSGNDKTNKLTKPRKSWRSNEGSSSFKGVGAAIGSFRILGRGSGRIAPQNELLVDKPLSLDS